MQDDAYKNKIAEQERYYKSLLFDVTVEISKALYARPNANPSSNQHASDAFDIAQYILNRTETLDLKKLAKSKIDEAIIANKSTQSKTTKH